MKKSFLDILTEGEVENYQFVSGPLRTRGKTIPPDQDPISYSRDFINYAKDNGYEIEPRNYSLYLSKFAKRDIKWIASQTGLSEFEIKDLCNKGKFNASKSL